MMRGRTVAGGFLVIGFGFISLVLLVIEPRMGFATVADYFDPSKVFAASAAAPWILGDIFYLGFGVALVYLAVTSVDEYLRAAGLVAAAGFFLVGCLDRVAASIPVFVGDTNQQEAALIGLLSVRLAVLRTSVFSLGIVAWRTTVTKAGRAQGSVLWRGLGLLVLAVSVAFVFVFLPVPVVFAVWAAWFTARQIRDA
jgi:hypothetical protein